MPTSPSTKPITFKFQISNFKSQISNLPNVRSALGAASLLISSLISSHLIPSHIIPSRPISSNHIKSHQAGTSKRVDGYVP